MHGFFRFHRCSRTVRHLLLAGMMVGSGSDFLAADDSSQTLSGSDAAIRQDSAEQPVTARSERPLSDGHADSEDGTPKRIGQPLTPEAASVLPPELFRPLSEVRLAKAIAAESLAEEPLREPRDLAAEIYGTKPVFHDVVGFSVVPRPWRDSFRVCHWPLYFEESALERCGYGRGALTDGVSALRFFGRVPLLPYLVTVAPPFSCQ